MISESRIISMLQARDERALRTISEQYGKLCCQIAFRILGNREDAEECVSDMLVAVWNAIPPDYPENLRAYLAAVVRRIAVNRYKQAHRQKRGGTVYTTTLDELAEIIPSPDRVEQQIEQHELTAALTAWLRTLPPKTCRIFMQRYFLSETVQTIAAQNHMSISAVKMSLLRSRNRLKDYLREEGLL